MLWSTLEGFCQHWAVQHFLHSMFALGEIPSLVGQQCKSFSRINKKQSYPALGFEWVGFDRQLSGLAHQ